MIRRTLYYALTAIPLWIYWRFRDINDNMD
jgi:hypothetical protein